MIVDAWERAMELADVVGLDGVDTPIFDQLALEREGGGSALERERGSVFEFADLSVFFDGAASIKEPEVSWWGRVKGWFRR